MEGTMQSVEERAGETQRKYNTLRQEEIAEEIGVIMLRNDAPHKHARAVYKSPRMRGAPIGDKP